MHLIHLLEAYVRTENVYAFDTPHFQNVFNTFLLKLQYGNNSMAYFTLTSEVIYLGYVKHSSQKQNLPCDKKCLLNKGVI